MYNVAGCGTWRCEIQNRNVSGKSEETRALKMHRQE